MKLANHIFYRKYKQNLILILRTEWRAFANHKKTKHIVNIYKKQDIRRRGVMVSKPTLAKLITSEYDSHWVLYSFCLVMHPSHY